MCKDSGEVVKSQNEWLDKIRKEYVQVRENIDDDLMVRNPNHSYSDDDNDDDDDDDDDVGDDVDDEIPDNEISDNKDNS
ncbi:hypothetical protein Glove_103g275 [Diversispora epigaea]|uniref:Uncharacterized protein n=1 Tax=Diversispora epigaea TaxID=1348612 RepID=A0A397JDP5_9GLOM|nr:hypothetical protein Glove_103g275 [Diversispora epigaea]